MQRLSRRALWLAVFGLLAAVSVLAVRGYFAPEAMLYFLTFRWCA